MQDTLFAVFQALNVQQLHARSSLALLQQAAAGGGAHAFTYDALPLGVRAKVQHYLAQHIVAYAQQQQQQQQQQQHHHHQQQQQQAWPVPETSQRTTAKRAACTALLSSPRKREAAALKRLYTLPRAPHLSHMRTGPGVADPGPAEDSLWAAASASSLAGLAHIASLGALTPSVTGVPSDAQLPLGSTGPQREALQQRVIDGGGGAAPYEQGATGSRGPPGPRRGSKGRDEHPGAGVATTVLGSEALDSSVKAAMLAMVQAELLEAEERVKALRQRLAQLAD